MSEQTEVALDVATDEVVKVAPTEGQVQDQPASEDTPDEAPEKTRAQERRERQKAYEKQLRDDAASAKREAEQLKQRLERLTKVSDPPKESDFTDPFEYAAASGAYKARQSAAQLDAGLIEEDVQKLEQKADQAEGQRMQMRVDLLKEGAKKAKEVYTDFDDAMQIAADPRFVSHDLSKLVLESDEAADLSYYLGKNPAVAQQLSQMPLPVAALHLGRIEATLAKPKPITATSAPEPITPLKGNGGGSRNPDKMSYAEFKAYREKGGTVNMR